MIPAATSACSMAATVETRGSVPARSKFRTASTLSPAASASSCCPIQRCARSADLRAIYHYIFVLAIDLHKGTMRAKLSVRIIDYPRPCLVYQYPVRQFVVWEDLYRRIVLAKISIFINYLLGKHYRADHDGTSTSSDPSSTDILSNRHSPDARRFFCRIALLSSFGYGNSP
jgi:hypothetical protein